MTEQAPDDGLWLTITELAAQEGVGKPTISEKVARLEADGLISTKPGKNRSKLVNLAQYHLAIGKVGDAAKETGHDTRSAAAPIEDDAPAGDPTYRDAQAREKKYKADLAELEVRQRLGELVPVDRIADDVSKLGEAIVREIERLPLNAETMANAVGRDGAAGARAQYKRDGRALRIAIVAALRDLVSAHRPADALSVIIADPAPLWGDLDPAEHR